MAIKVALLDDNLIWLSGLAQAIDDYPDFEVVFTATSKERYRAEALDQKPQVAILDLRLPTAEEGIEFALELQELLPHLCVIFMSAYEKEMLPWCARMALDQVPDRPIAFLYKDRVDPATLRRDLTTIASGGTIMDSQIAAWLVDEMKRRITFTETERNVLEYIVQGWTNARINQELHQASAVTDRHVTEIFRKLGVADAEGQYNKRVLAAMRWKLQQA